MDVIDFVSENVDDLGLDYMVSAARNGDTRSIMYLAKAFDSGLNLGQKRNQSFKESLSWYQLAVDNEVEKKYLVIARMAEIMLMDESGETR